MAAAAPATPAHRHVHGDRGAYHAGCWVEMEDLGKEWASPKQVYSGDRRVPPPPPVSGEAYDADVVIIGAGCIGAAIARQLVKSQLRVVLLDSADDVTQGATKGNSGIVHAGFDDVPGSTRAKLCWKGNQMFPQLDRELRFGFQRNGSLVVARGAEDEKTLEELLQRGAKNGVQRLRIVGQAELRAMEPAIAPDATAALFSPDAGTLTPYEYAIALAENAVDNGVELRLNRRVVALAPLAPGGGFAVSVLNTSPSAPPSFGGNGGATAAVGGLLLALLLIPAVVGGALLVAPDLGARNGPLASVVSALSAAAPPSLPHTTLLAAVVASCLAAAAAVVLLTRRGGKPAPSPAVAGPPETIRARFVVNAAGLGSGDIARLAGDSSFYIKPRLGEYLLLHKKEGAKARHILFPAPGPMGKGVLVQTTLWGNLILGPTAADVGDPATIKRTAGQIMSAILSRCRDLVPGLDAGEVIHSFSGQRAKSSRGDWIIERCATAPDLVHVAGIDSPGLAGSPAIALEVVALLKGAGLPLTPNPSFNPNRRPIIVPKEHHHLHAACIDPSTGAVTKTKMRVDGATPSTNIICKCERVLESEVCDAIHRSLPCASTQAVRKRTRAGMGHCQGEFCEERVKAVIARETGVPVSTVPGRPWPATSILPARWLTEEQRAAIRGVQ